MEKVFVFRTSDTLWNSVPRIAWSYGALFKALQCLKRATSEEDLAHQVREALRGCLNEEQLLNFIQGPQKNVENSGAMGMKGLFRSLGSESKRDVFVCLLDHANFGEPPESFFGPSVLTNLASIGITDQMFPGVPKEINALYRILYDESDAAPRVIPYSGILDALEQAKREGGQFYVVAGKARKALDKELKDAGLEAIFAGREGTDPQGENVSQKEITLRLFEKEGLDPESCWGVVGKPSDVRSLREAGIDRVIGVAWSQPDPVKKDVLVNAFVETGVVCVVRDVFSFLPVLHNALVAAGARETLNF